MRTSELTPVLAAVAVAGALWMVLPVRMPAAAGEPSTAECLAIADRQSQDAAALVRCGTIVPNDVELKADLGATYESAGRVDEAIALYRQIIELDPWYADIRVRLAMLLRARGDRAEAARQLDEALRIQPNRQSIRDLIGAAP